MRQHKGKVKWVDMSRVVVIEYNDFPFSDVGRTTGAPIAYNMYRVINYM